MAAPLRRLAAAGALAAASAHICLMHPVQRGGFNVTDAGDNTCYNTAPPCGSAPAGSPVMTLAAGQWNPVFLQQNLNHYAAGHPGGIRVSMAFKPNPVQADFIELLYIPDFFAHLQARQTNLSFGVLAPPMTLPHGVLQVVYAPNQPGEVPFLQCADVAIAPPASAPPAGDGPLYGLLSQGGSVVGQSRSTLVGRWSSAGNFNGFAAAPSGVELLEDLLTVSPAGDALYALGRATAGEAFDDGPANALVVMPAAGQPGAATVFNISAAEAPDHWQALVPVDGAAYPQQLALVGVEVDPASGNYTLQARYVNASDGAAGPVLARCPPGQRFVNFQWATRVVGGKLHVLAGDENSLVQLYAAVFAIDLAAGSCAMAELDVSAFTFSSLHAHPDTGALYAVSPGLYGQAAYTLVSVDAATGAVAAVGGGVSPAGTPAEDGFAWEYRGGVAGDSMVGGALLHVFTRALDGQRVLAQIDLASGRTLGTPAVLLTGTNGETAFTTPVFSAAAAASTQAEEKVLSAADQLALVRRARAAVRHA